MEVERNGEVFVMMASNLSLSGVFLEGDPQDHPGFERNAILHMTLSLAESSAAGDEGTSSAPPPDSLKVRGKIVRIQPTGTKAAAGFGLLLMDVQAVELRKLTTMLNAKR